MHERLLLKVSVDETDYRAIHDAIAKRRSLLEGFGYPATDGEILAEVCLNWLERVAMDEE